MKDGSRVGQTDAPMFILSSRLQSSPCQSHVSLVSTKTLVRKWYPPNQKIYVKNMIKTVHSTKCELVTTMPSLYNKNNKNVHHSAQHFRAKYQISCKYRVNKSSNVKTPSNHSAAFILDTLTCSSTLTNQYTREAISIQWDHYATKITKMYSIQQIE